MTAAKIILKRHWGFDNFRPLQEEIINSILEQNDTLALLPTGGGKSLCYQVPALIMDGFCLVVSPLIALMQDQVQKLHSLDIMAASIHAGMHYSDVKRRLENMIHGPYKFLYVSPERLQTELFKEYLPAFNINLIAVDEAHCISQWGHDFRPDYLKIAALKEIFDDVPLLALTASATPEVQQDIAMQLKLDRPAVYQQSFERENIFYDIRYSENKNNDLLEHLKNNAGSCIVYCRSRRQTETLSRYLSQHNIPSLFYHAGIAKEKRQEIQKMWMQNEVPIMIATTAFGMGIDKPDVLSVIHYDAPEHLEAYYQESGRAGRDRKGALAITLYNSIDINRLNDSVSLQFPPENYLKKVYQSVAEYLQIPISAEPYRYYNFELQDFCKRFKLDALPASYALRLLEQEGLWTLSDAVFEPATIHFVTTRQRLEELTVTYPELAMVTTGLLRLYGTIFHYPTPVRLPVIAKQIRLKTEDTERLLFRLDNMGIIEYSKPLEGPQLFFHHYRVDSRHLIINMQRINKLKKQHQVRTQAMIAFLQNDRQCRNKQLLSYFKEIANDYCGHCDVCRDNKNAVQLNAKQLRTEIRAALTYHTTISVTDISSRYPTAIRESLLTLIRQMIDEGEVKLHTNGWISVK